MTCGQSEELAEPMPALSHMSSAFSLISLQVPMRKMLKSSSHLSNGHWIPSPMLTSMTVLVTLGGSLGGVVVNDGYSSLINEDISQLSVNLLSFIYWL
jgi:hypothetical protein